MEKQLKKGKFYTLPIVDIREEREFAFFIVKANNREYAIRMFDFQRRDPKIRELQELPCMVKDLHGDNIVFVQNFAQMFSDRYENGKSQPFIVRNGSYDADTDTRYYEVTDSDGVPFKLRCASDIYLVPRQRIKCIVTKPSVNKIELKLDQTTKTITGSCISPKKLLVSSGLDDKEVKFILDRFNSHEGFAEAREFCDMAKQEWVIKALLAVKEVENWPNLGLKSKLRLLKCYYKVCQYVLEDSDFLLKFSEYERENYQELLAEKMEDAETTIEGLKLVMEKTGENQVDNILAKIKSSGYICNPDRRMRLLISIFSLDKDLELLDKKIDIILDIIEERARYWKLESFKVAFSRFLEFYIMRSRKSVNKQIMADLQENTEIISRMVRSISYLLLMNEGDENDMDPNKNTQYYRSLLFYYLSFAQSKNVLSGSKMEDCTSALIGQSFDSLMMSGVSGKDFSWNDDIRNAEILAYKMYSHRPENTTFLTRTLESGNVRFTVSSEGITLSRSTHTDKERNVMPQDFMDLHNFQIFLDSPSKYTISKTSRLKSWKSYWTDVEEALFEDRPVATKPKIRKVSPEIGSNVNVRVLFRDDENEYRYYCKIEDDYYEGEGWIDTYNKGGSMGIFHYDPMLDINSFYEDGSPILLTVTVNSVIDEHIYMFNAVNLIDECIKDSVNFGDVLNCVIIIYDSKNKIYCGVTEFGYGIFLKDSEEHELNIGDTYKVQVTDASRPNAIQGQVLDVGDDIVDIKEAAETLLFNYKSGLYEEDDDELEEEAMSAAEDTFDKDYIYQLIDLLDHRSQLFDNNITKSYACLALAHILARMIEDSTMMKYLEVRERFIDFHEFFKENGNVDQDDFYEYTDNHIAVINESPCLNQLYNEMLILNSFGQQDKNQFLWEITSKYSTDHVLHKLAQLMLSYNLVDGFGLQNEQGVIRDKIKKLLNLNVELPETYTFGEESQLVEFKTSIVYPPNNNMRPDIKKQTFNIMKVICGMANSYGGTLYLGVYDTGTAKGLEDDLKEFEHSKDKYDLYVRNQIRMNLGDVVNAGITVEHPNAGKHWIYAVKVKPSKTPVRLKLDNNFYLREGTSTCYIEEQELTEIMETRNFDSYGVNPTVDSATTDTVHEEKVKETVQKPEIETSEQIATSKIRNNALYDWEDGYGMDTSCYIRIQNYGEWCVLDEVLWEDGILTLAVHDDEAKGSLIIVYEDGSVNRVPFSQILDKARGKIYKMYSTKKPIFISPVKKDAALLTAYKDDRGKYYVRVDDVADMDEGKMLSSGKTVTDVDFAELYHCEVVDHEYLQALKRLHNPGRATLGFQGKSEYGNKERAVLEKMGIII